MSSVSSASSNNVAYYASQKNLFSKLDTDQDGTLTQDEFVAGRPKNTSESQASTLYSKIDTANSGAVTEDQFNEGMDSNQPSKGIESLLSGDAMAVLMLMSQQGGMSFDSGAGGNSDGSPSASDIYAGMDTDGDGSVTQAEFVAARPDDMSEDDATALYGKIDTESTGSITEDQFAAALKSEGEHGGHHGGGGMPSQGADGTDSASEVYDALDVNKDGVVSEEEFLAGHPADVTDEQASDLFKSIDTEGTGSITKDQFTEFADASTATQDTSQPAFEGVDLTKGINDILTILQSLSANSESVSSEPATEAA